MMKEKIIGLSLVLMIGALSAQATIFTQDFSSSTNAGDYVDAVPTINQFSLINGGAISIESGRLKIVNAADIPGNVRRWVEMEGTPVDAMSFSYEFDLVFSEPDGTRLFTGTIGDPFTGNHFMAWGVDASGTDNVWNVTGTTNIFTGAQTMTLFLNDSNLAIDYEDPAGGTQVLFANSYDIWIGSTLVADGKNDLFVLPENNLTTFNFGLGITPAVTYYFDNFDVSAIPYNPVSTVYQDDFSGAATSDAMDTVPEVSLPGFIPASFSTGLDGGGRLESSSATAANANYRFQIDTAPLTDDATLADIKYTVTMRTPTNDWVMVGFQENNANGFLTEAVNAGPIVQFNPRGSVILRGGTWGGGNISATFLNNYTNSEVITAEMTYHVVAETMDLVINGITVINGFALNHEFPVGTNSAPVVYWAQLQLRNQPSAANGGAYVDSFQIEATKEPGYLGWAAGWGVDLGAKTDDYDGDGLINIHEYGLGGDPTDAADQGTAPESGIMDVGGTSWFGYVHPQLSDPNSGLIYSLELSTDVVLGTWTNSGYRVEGTNVTGNALDFVTNVTDTVDGNKFIRLIIE